MDAFFNVLYPDDMKPIIGINLDIKDGPPPEASVQTTYYSAIQKAGGIPLLIPPLPDDDISQVLKLVSGLLFIGGNDYCPSNYGENQHDTVSLCHRDREGFDLRLIKEALRTSSLPILGICAGAQLLNIALGGTLVQDIQSEFPDSEVIHTNSNGWSENPHKHAVRLQAHTELANIYKRTDLDVPTSHHQSIKVLGSGLTAVAWATDGVVEAVESKTRPFTIGVQWHPERDYETHRDLFEEFVLRCKSELMLSK